VERNLSLPENVCASHDFCDANETMAAAIESVIGHCDTQDDATVSLWNAAWREARAVMRDAAGFESRRATLLRNALRDELLSYDWESDGAFIVGRTGNNGGATVSVFLNFDGSISADWQHNAGREESYWGNEFDGPTDAAERLAQWLEDL
jgi:hypothetical protein